MSYSVREKGAERAQHSRAGAAPLRDPENFRFQTVHLSLSATTGLRYGLIGHYLTIL